MISKVNFTGRVFYAGSTKALSAPHDKERKELSKYARRNNCDVMVLDRDYYSGGEGKYTTIVSKENTTTGKNLLYKAIFDFQKSNTEVRSIDI